MYYDREYILIYGRRKKRSYIYFTFYILNLSEFIIRSTVVTIRVVVGLE